MDFEFEAPVSFFEKADAPEGKQKRIGGIISTETPDQQGEIVLQRGLDFKPFLQGGWFNDNHSKQTTGILGYPEKVRRFERGTPLPDGTTAKTRGTWAEGYLLDTPEAKKVWELGQALQQTGRRLGFSIEGKIEKREGARGNKIAQAVVRNVAITNCPVNQDSRLEVLAKSLLAFGKSEAEAEEAERLHKMMGMGTTAAGFNPGVHTTGPMTGMGAGQVVTPKSLEMDGQLRVLTAPKPDEEDKKKMGKSLTDAEAVRWVQTRLSCSTPLAERIVQATWAMKRAGQL